MNREIVGYSPTGGWTSPLQTLRHLDSSKTFIAVFGVSNYQPEHERALAELHAAFPASKIVGGSSAGEIFNNRVFDNTMSIAICRFEHTELRIEAEPVRLAGDSRAAGAAIGRRLASPNLRAVFVLSEGLEINGSELVAGIRESCSS
ncbi:MAG TPA: FIST N-terminal domain-containing protein, partial [Bdellovibrionales bacterium]|nr:FIST N-terminal domain-containing protein [Bdellovibrionales bacterium]